MEFEDFPKEYEDVFTNERTLKKCNIDLVSTDNETDINSYISQLHSVVGNHQLELFDSLVKITWLFKRFCYRGARRKSLGSNGVDLDGSFGVFMRRHVGFDPRLITKSNTNYKVMGYFYDFFPDFDINNPFKTEYKYPYKHMNLEMLVLVANMPERLELLKIGENRTMGYTEFFDYIINYINCYNDKHGKTYEFIFSKVCVSYIKKYEGKKI